MTGDLDVENITKVNELLKIAQIDINMIVITTCNTLYVRTSFINYITF